jgi:hypothetical protein
MRRSDRPLRFKARSPAQYFVCAASTAFAIKWNCSSFALAAADHSPPLRNHGAQRPSAEGVMH